MEKPNYDETTMRMAYSQAMKLKRSGLDDEMIYGRLEKQGIPEELIADVIKNINSEQRRSSVRQTRKTNYNVALIKVGVGVLAAVVSAFLFPGYVIVPVGLIFSGVLLAILTK